MYIDVYTDGSYRRTLEPNKVYGGVVVLKKTKSDCREVVSIRRISSSMPVLVEAQSFGGEILAAIMGLMDSISGVDPDSNHVVTLHHDNEGIAKFINGQFKASKPSAMLYVNEVQAWVRSNPNVKLKFVKVKAHSNNKYNNLADNVANGVIPGIYTNCIKPNIEM